MQVDTGKNDLACRMFAVEKAMQIAHQNASKIGSPSDMGVDAIITDAEKILAFVNVEAPAKSKIIAVHGRVGS